MTDTMQRTRSKLSLPARPAVSDASPTPPAMQQPRAEPASVPGLGEQPFVDAPAVYQISRPLRRPENNRLANIERDIAILEAKVAALERDAAERK